MSLLVFGIVLPWVVVGLGCWIGYQLIKQNGRILLRLDILEQTLAQQAIVPSQQLASTVEQTLSIGSTAPAFELPDLYGRLNKLEQFRGRRVLLLFFNPRCGYCEKMAADLALLPPEGGNGSPLPLVITTGPIEENKSLVEKHGIRCIVLHQEETEVASVYGAGGTPMGYLIDEEGRIASDLTVGASDLLTLSELQGTNAAENERRTGAESGNTRAAQDRKGNRDLSTSRLKRDGLPVGTAAPNFRLPRLDGGESSLEEFRGRPLLLVFSDPNCGPCNELAPRLEDWHRRRSDVRVLMISRGSVDANRTKERQHGLTFPILLQRQWEISREYARFETPIGYLINERGIIASDVALGTDRILALLAAESSKVTAVIHDWDGEAHVTAAQGDDVASAADVAATRA